LKAFDYSKPSAYFLTICTRDKKQLFGKVVGHGVTLNALGTIVNDSWLAIPDHFRNVELVAHVVMPNHLHGIVIIRQQTMQSLLPAETAANSARGEGSAKVERRAQRAVPLRRENVGPRENVRTFGALPPGSISTIVRSLKSASTKRIRQTLRNPQFTAWQRGFYEHVIRDVDDFKNTCEYIRLNPARWSFDEENR
jgi:REP element-mobilizing transposase RayT